MTDRPEVDLYEALKSAKEYQDTMQGLNPSFCAKIKTLSDTAAKYRTLAKALEAGEVRIVPTSPDYEMIYQMQIEGCPYPVQTYEAAIKAAPEWEWGGG